MTVRVGINGFGRIGRSFVRVLLDRQALTAVDVVAINEPNADPETLAFLLEHDSVAGRLGVDVEATERGLRLDGRDIAVTDYAEPAEIPWSDHERRSCCRSQWALPIARGRRGTPRRRGASSRHLRARPGR